MSTRESDNSKTEARIDYLYYIIIGSFAIALIIVLMVNGNILNKNGDDDSKADKKKAKSDVESD